MHLPTYLEIPLRLALLVVGLLVPGSMLLRALRLPWSLAAAFAASVAALYSVVLVFAWTGGVISLVTLGSALALVALLARLVPARASSTQLSSSFACFGQMGWWLPLYAAFWLIVAWRLGVHPLNGPDNSFRWSWLAEQMLHFGSLDFYPPRNAADYVRYFWAESIPPGVAGLYTWAYACGGSNHPLWTSPVVALQLLAVHELVWRLGSRWGGEVVARHAVLLAAACPLLTWSVIMGQETGLTALAVIGIVWSLQHLRDDHGNRWAVLAAIFSIVASSTREYGPIFPVATVAATLWLQAPGRQTWLVAAIALPVALAWPARVWLLTGNPFYSLNVAGMFPFNPIFAVWNDTLRGPVSRAATEPAAWLVLGRYLLLWGLPAMLGAIALVILLVQRLREMRILAVYVGLVVILWLVSMAYTAGGLFYSLRVLSPALALLVVVAGYGLGFWVQHRAATQYLAVGVALLLLESLPKTLVLPENPYRLEARLWPMAADQFPAVVNAINESMRAKLEPLPDRGRVLSDHPGLQRVLAPIGTEVVPLWSPEIVWLFDQTLKPDEVAQHWRNSGFRYLILAKTGSGAGFMQSHARWMAPYFQMKTVKEIDTHVILEVTVPPDSPK